MKKTRRTYVYSLSDHFEEYSNNLEGLNKLYDDLIKSEKNSVTYFCVQSSRNYDSNFKLIYQSKGNLRLYKVLNLEINDDLFNCMSGTIYIFSNDCIEQNIDKKLKRSDYIFIRENMIAKINFNDIYECDIIVNTNYKNIVSDMIEYYKLKREDMEVK